MKLQEKRETEKAEICDAIEEDYLTRLQIIKENEDMAPKIIIMGKEINGNNSMNNSKESSDYDGLREMHR